MGENAPVLDRFEWTPRFHEIDSYRIVHHSAYFCWFEEGRQRLLAKRGMDFSLPLLENMQFVVIHAEATFRSPVRPGQRVLVETALPEGPTARLKFHHRVLRFGHTRPFIEATVSLAVVQEGRLLLNLPDSIRSKFNPPQRSAQ